MNDRQRTRLKKFGDKLAADSEVDFHQITVRYTNGDVENNWSGIGQPPARPFSAGTLAMVEDAEVIDD